MFSVRRFSAWLLRFVEVLLASCLEWHISPETKPYILSTSRAAQILIPKPQPPALAPFPLLANVGRVVVVVMLIISVMGMAMVVVMIPMPEYS